MVLFPEISREYVTRATPDNLASIEVTSGLGWVLLVLWAMVTVLIDIVYLI